MKKAGRNSARLELSDPVDYQLNLAPNCVTLAVLPEFRVGRRPDTPEIVVPGSIGLLG